VVLGASNVRRGMTTVVQTAREAWGPNLEIFGAFGHGRSYGARSCIPFRCLPGILECGIWNSLPPAGVPETAVVTDVGNDVVYGASVPTILGWVGECLDRLAARGARIRVTALPIARLGDVGPDQYLFFRSLFFRGSRVPWRAALEGIRELDAGLRRLSGSAGATVVDPPREWYGTDPIHIRRSHRRAAWAAILGVAESRRSMPLGEAIRLRMAVPGERWIAGIEQRRRQPAIRLETKTPVSLF